MKMDLKAAFTRAMGEVMERYAKAAQERSSSTVTVSFRFGGTSFQGAVLFGSAATRLTADELSIDLLTTIASGLTEERLAALLKRWSKAARKAGDSPTAMDAID